jgi:branched-chain amino acid transport system substrate-binding protein
MVNSFKTPSAIFAFLLLGLFAPTHAQKQAPKSYASIATDGEGYAGPGRAAANDLPGPIIRIGILAPLHGERKPEGDAMVAAAQMALRDAAPRGVVHGHHVALAVEDSSGPSWGKVSDAVIRLVLEDEAVALITSTSGADAHISEQVGNRVGVPVLTLAADATTTQADIPWIFRMGASDKAEAQLIANELYNVRRIGHILLITQHGHDGDRGTTAMSHAAADLRSIEPVVVTLSEDQLDIDAAVQKIHVNSPQAIVIWTNTITAARLLPALRAAGVTSPCYLSEDASFSIPNVASLEFPGGEVWKIAEDVRISPTRQAFASGFQQSTGRSPNAIATRTYDAVTLIVEALQAVGPNRARVRDQLSRGPAFEGMSGKISFDREGNNQVASHLVKLQ